MEKYVFKWKNTFSVTITKLESQTCEQLLETTANTLFEAITLGSIWIELNKAIWQC